MPTTTKKSAKKSVKKKARNNGRVTVKPRSDKRVYVRKEAAKLADEQIKAAMLQQAKMGYTIDEMTKLNVKSKCKLYSMINGDQNFKEEFYKARDIGRVFKNSEVEDALYRRAIGTTIKKQLAFKSKGEEIKKTTVTEEIPPDTSAAIHILSTQKRGRWNPKTIVHHEGEVKNEVVIYEIPSNNRDRVDYPKKQDPLDDE